MPNSASPSTLGPVRYLQNSQGRPLFFAKKMAVNGSWRRSRAYISEKRNFDSTITHTPGATTNSIMAAWSRGMIPASGAGDPGFDSGRSNFQAQSAGALFMNSGVTPQRNLADGSFHSPSGTDQKIWQFVLAVGEAIHSTRRVERSTTNRNRNW